MSGGERHFSFSFGNMIRGGVQNVKMQEANEG